MSDDETVMAGALARLIRAVHDGYHALVVPPAVAVAVAEGSLPAPLKEQLQLVHRNWLESQGLMRRATRVIRVAGRREDHGQQDGKFFEAYAGFLDSEGLHREASFVAEAWSPDTRFIKLMMRLVWGLNESELRRYWTARAEAGGGANIQAYVARFLADPTPIVLLCDRDAGAPDECGVTAGACVDATVAAGLFDDRAQALRGGFSSYRAGFGFAVSAGHELENFLFPHVLSLVFKHTLPQAEIDRRIAVLQLAFPRFPYLTEDEAAQWLASDLKSWPDFGSLINNDMLNRFLQQVETEPDAFEELATQWAADARLAHFRLAPVSFTDHVWTVGARSSPFF